MDKYTLLLVDDEEEVIQIIMKKIAWEEIGFSVIGHANNGVKALEMVEEYQPDVVITDIKMPYMDGMEMAKHIKTDYPDTKILFFTGFDEFEYARAAVRAGVTDYLLKPLKDAELHDVLNHPGRGDSKIHIGLSDFLYGALFLLSGHSHFLFFKRRRNESAASVCICSEAGRRTSGR